MILNEKNVEDNISNILEELNYKSLDKFNINEQTLIVNYELLRKKMILINNDYNEKYIDEAIRKLKSKFFNINEDGNKEFVSYLKNGVPIQIKSIDDRTFNIKIIDLNNFENNSFNFIRQLEIYYSNFNKIIPDILIYVNGLPLSIIEVKSPEAKEKIEDAYKQVVNYSNKVKELSYWNILSVATNGFETKYGSLFSNFSQWWSWKKISIDDEIIQDDDIVEYPEIAINNVYKNIMGLFSKETFLNIIKIIVIFL